MYMKFLIHLGMRACFIPAAASLDILLFVFKCVLVFWFMYVPWGARF